MKFKQLFFVLAIGLFVACVPKKDFVNLQNRFDNLQSQNDLLTQKLKDCQKDKSEISVKLDDSQSTLNQLQSDYDELQKKYERKEKALDNLEKSYNALEQNSSEILADNAKQNRELLKQLEEKEKALAEEQKRLEKLQKDLENRSYRIEQLENLIVSKEEKLRALKDRLSDALIDFKGKGLSVEQRDGKVYVSMENKLLFASGSWNVGSEGQKAIRELANVLAQNPDISVLIEGHTDNVPYSGNGPLKDNWDLSTKRATEVLKLLLRNSDINPKNLTAAGRGKYMPVDTNETESGRAKNRRIEVVLEPRLDKINQLLED